MTGYEPLVALRFDANEVRRVDCGTCPVTIACALEEGGNGYTFTCCGSTGFMHEDENGLPLLLMIDCAAHKFETNEVAREMPACPLCTGDVTYVALRQLGTRSLWVPTVHAKVPVETRLDVWRRTLPQTEARAAADQKKYP